jgi:hypothetical protein
MLINDNVKVLSEEIVKLDDELDELIDHIEKYSRRTVSRRLRKVGERYIFLSKAIRTKNLFKSIEKERRRRKIK